LFGQSDVLEYGKVIFSFNKQRRKNMEFLKKVGTWADELTKIGISIIALGVVLEVLFKGANIPFWPNVSVVDNIMGILGSLSAEGLLGLVGAFVL